MYPCQHLCKRGELVGILIRDMDVYQILIFLPVLLMSVVLHEYMHGYIAYLQGDHTAHSSGRLTLNPLAHIDPFTTVLMPLVLLLLGAPPFGAAKPVPFNPRNFRNGETGLALVALAGPATNIVLAALFGFFYQVLPISGLLGDALLMGVLVNVSLGVFNIIPWPPLDGSRILYVLAPDVVRDVMNRIEAFGIAGVVFFFFVVFQLFQPTFIQAVNVLVNLFAGF